MINTLTDFDINKILKHYKIDYNGIFSKNELPSKLLNGFYVINMESSDKGHGSHWVALYKINDGYSQYFDSFGVVPPLDIENKLHKYDYNDRDIQDINSSSCGFYCVGFIKFMNGKSDLKKSFKTFIKMFDNDTKRNEEILYNILYN